MRSVKAQVSELLEGHPYGHALQCAFIDKFEVLLPHHPEYLAFGDLARRFAFPTKTILDLGANRGSSARAFLKLLPGWQVVSFEANPIHKESLEAIKLKHSDRFSFHMSALSDRPRGDVNLYTPVYKGLAVHTASSISEKEAIAGVEAFFPALAGRFSLSVDSTETTSVDAMELDASFVKVDVPGEQLPVLQGMNGLIGRCKPVILVEMNLAPKGVERFLEAQSYLPWIFDADAPHAIHFRPGRQAYSIRHRNQLFMHEVHESIVS